MVDAIIRPLLLSVLVLLGGCRAAPRLPTYPLADESTSLALIADRQAAIASTQGTATVEIARDSTSVILDAAFVAQPPNRVRLRAWKLNRPVLDATMRDDELWLVVPEEADDPSRLADAERIGEGVRRAFELMGAGFFRSARADESRTTPSRLIAVGTVGGVPVTCTIDRPTLTPRRFEIMSHDRGNGATSPSTSAATIDLDDYRQFGGSLWPMTITIQSPDGRVVIHARDIEINAPVQPNAFTPPRRAVRRS